MIVVFGSINADLIFQLASAPMPGQTVLAQGLRMEAGGKGANQAVAAARDGAEVIMVGAVGSDPLRDIACAQLASSGVDTTQVKTVEEATGCASILVDADGRNQIAVALGANAKARADQVDAELLGRASYLLLQMESNPADVETLMRRARAAGVRTILNLAPAIRLEPDVLRLCELLVVNESEAGEVAGWLGCGETARQLRDALGIDVLRTLGSQGSEVATDTGDCLVQAVKVHAIDTTAAGDCFVGVLAAALDSGTSLEAAMKRASHAAALACTRSGSQRSLPAKAEIDAFALQTATASSPAPACTQA